ncbi:MAG: ABC transporter permease, partial [Chloroflexota bacterium]
LPPDATRDAFHPPGFQVESINTAVDAGVALDARQAASRYVLGLVFVILLLISIIIYGMWVATGVAAEKSSRVMELMISAASAPQMLTGKVVGIGAAGLTQYIAIAIPAFVLLGLQNQIATAVLGPDWVTGAPLGGLSGPLLVGYGVFFMLGYVLFALIYASMGSFVSRPDDLQTLSLPLSLVAMSGYLVAVVALGGATGTVVVLLSFLPPFSPFVMLARIMVSAVQPWEIVLSVALLVATIAVVAVIATRMYAAGVLLYGQRPGLRAFVAAARRG